MRIPIKSAAHFREVIEQIHADAARKFQSDVLSADIDGLDIDSLDAALAESEEMAEANIDEALAWLASCREGTERDTMSTLTPAQRDELVHQIASVVNEIIQQKLAPLVARIEQLEREAAARERDSQ